MGENSAHGAIKFDEQVQKNVDRIRRRRLALAFHGNHAIHREALVAIVRRNQHPAPITTDGDVVVVPAWESLTNVAPQAGTQTGVLKALEQVGAPTFVGPWRNDAD